MLEVKYLSPWVAKISDPWQTCLQSQTTTDKVHRLRRSGAYYQIHRMLFQIFLEELHRWADPEATRIRTEKIATHPHRRFLKKRLILGIHRIDFDNLIAVT